MAIASSAAARTFASSSTSSGRKRVERRRVQRARQGFGHELLAVRVERRRLFGERLHGVLGERAQGLDRRVAQTHVVAGFERERSGQRSSSGEGASERATSMACFRTRQSLSPSARSR